jgi:hypothetical protein
MMMMMMMMMMMRVQDAANDAAHMVMVMMMMLRQPRVTGRRRRVALSVVCLEQGQRIRDRREEVPVSRSRFEPGRWRRGRGLRAIHGGQGGSRPQQTGYLLVHGSSSGIPKKCLACLAIIRSFADSSPSGRLTAWKTRLLRK